MTNIKNIESLQSNDDLKLNLNKTLQNNQETLKEKNNKVSRSIICKECKNIFNWKSELNII